MNISDVRNNHLRNLIVKISTVPENHLSDDLVDELIGELSLATFICPTCDGEIELVQLGPNAYIPAFTGFDEFERYGNSQPVSWEFVRCYELLQHIDGVIIDPYSLGFVVDLDIIAEVFNRFLKFNDFHDLNSHFSHEQLNEFRNIKNPELDRLLNTDVDLAELYEELSKSILFTFIGSFNDGDEYAEEGIIPMDKLQIEGLTIINELGMECGLIFTSFDYLEPVYSYIKNNGRNIYPHIINLEIMARFIIELDLDALIINHAHQMVILPRQYVLSDLEYIVDLCSDNVKDDFTDFVYLKNYSSKSMGYDVKVRLDDFRPLTWRDLIIPSGITFRDLDNILKILWDFSGYHLSRFTFKDSFDVVTNEFPDIDFNPGELDSSKVVIDHYFESNKKIYWEYDYGDGWSFTIEIKKSVEYDDDYPLVKRFKGEYNPQDDIGGVWGLERLMNEDPSQLDKFNQEEVQDNLRYFRDFHEL